MKDVIKWLNAAIASGKETGGGMTYYKINEKTISASDGKLTACYPWKWGGKFFVPGKEFEKVLNRLPGEPQIVESDGAIKLKSGRFSGTIETMKLTEWDYPGVANAKWQKLPKGFVDLLTVLRPFISEEAGVAGWGNCIALDGGWAYATNNIAIAGSECCELGKCQALLPSWAIDFLISRQEGLNEWVWDESFMAFRWSNRAWMRTQLVVGKFPEKAAGMVQEACKAKTTQKVDDTFRAALERIGDLAEDTISIYSNRIEAKFGKARVEDGVQCEVPKGQECSIFGARYLLPVLKAAESWSPSTWPAPSPWKGKGISGYVVGRKV